MTTFYDLVPGAKPGRFDGIERNYGPEDVVKLRGSVQISHTLAERGAVKLWDLLRTEPYVNALGALSGNQAMQMVRAGLKAIYLSGWQVAADANTAGAMYPDQSLYPANSAPASMKAFMISKQFSVPPKPASASATIGANQSSTDVLPSMVSIWSARC